jgi:hypothetical protein
VDKPNLVDRMSSEEARTLARKIEGR